MRVDGVGRTGAGNLVTRLNLMPRAGFAHGSLGFGFNHDGTGAANIWFNWRGSAFLAGILSAKNGAPVPAVELHKLGLLRFGIEPAGPAATGPGQQAALTPPARSR